jgi:hypothetical protein
LVIRDMFGNVFRLERRHFAESCSVCWFQHSRKLCFVRSVLYAQNQHTVLSESIHTTFCVSLNSIFFFTHLHTMSHNDKVKTFFLINVFQMYWKWNTKISHLHKYSIHAIITFGSDYSCDYFWVSLRAFHTWIAQYLHIIIFKILQALSSWLLIIARQANIFKPI